MRKIECACGISLDIYSWPSAEIEQNGTKMIERHITCRCTREIVVRTAPKYEPDAEIGEDENVAAVSSFAELSRQFGVRKEAEPYNKPDAGGLNLAEPEVRVTLDLNSDDKKLFLSLLDKYARWFKQGKASAEDQKKFFGLHDRWEAATGPFGLTDEETRMSKMALSERNIYHVYGASPSEADKKVIDDLKLTLKAIYEA